MCIRDRRTAGRSGRQFEGRASPDSALAHHCRPPLLPDVGVKLIGRNALMTKQRLKGHLFRSGVEPVGGVSMAELVRADLLIDAGLVQHPAQAGAGRLREC